MTASGTSPRSEGVEEWRERFLLRAEGQEPIVGVTSPPLPIVLIVMISYTQNIVEQFCRRLKKCLNPNS